MSHHTWIHRIVEPLVKPLANTPIEPNHLTTLRLGAGVSAAGALAVGTPPWVAVGAGLFLVSALLDRADGTLARITEKMSRFGHKYDLFADSTSNALVFTGLGVGLRHGALGWGAVGMGVLAGLAVAAILWLTVHAESQDGERIVELGNVAGFDADDAVFVIPVAIWLGWSGPLLYAAAIGAPVFAMFFFWRHRRYLLRRRGPTSASPSRRAAR